VMTQSNLSIQWKDGDRPMGRSIPLRAEAGSLHFLPAQSGAKQLTLEMSLPVRGIAGVWLPYADRGTMQKMVWKGRLVGSPYWQGSLVSWIDDRLKNQFLLLPTPFDEEHEITWVLDQEAAAYKIRVAWIGQESSGRRGIHWSTAGEDIHALTRRLLQRHTKLPSPKTPSASFEPSFCTWYAYHGSISQRQMKACAERARQLGFGTFILDDGWSYDKDQRLNGSAKKWHQWNGGYDPAPTKFPDFREHVSEIQSLGLRYLLWIAPFIVGEKSAAFAQLRKHLLPSWLEEGFMVVDPRSRTAINLLTKSLKTLVAQYPVDGFKVDYDYALSGPGQTPRGLGPAYTAAVSQMVDGVRAIRPDIEWNLPASPFSRTVTGALRCIDVPFDFNSNRLFMANLAALSEGCALYSDPALWHPGEPASIVHSHLIPSLFVVPSVGAPIMSLSVEHLEAIKGWLAFYRRHQRVLNQGRFRAAWVGGDFQHFTRQLGRDRITAAFSGFPVEIDGKSETMVIHGAHDRSLILKVTGKARLAVAREDVWGRRKGPERVLGPGLHSVDCPPGGVLRVSDDR